MSKKKPLNTCSPDRNFFIAILLTGSLLFLTGSIVQAFTKGTGLFASILGMSPSVNRIDQGEGGGSGTYTYKPLTDKQKCDAKGPRYEWTGKKCERVDAPSNQTVILNSKKIMCEYGGEKFGIGYKLPVSNNSCKVCALAKDRKSAYFTAKTVPCNGSGQPFCKIYVSKDGSTYSTQPLKSYDSLILTADGKEVCGIFNGVTMRYRCQVKTTTKGPSKTTSTTNIAELRKISSGGSCE